MQFILKLVLVPALVAMPTSQSGLARAQVADAEKLVAESDPAIQEQFNRTYRAFFERPGAGNCDAYRELETLKDRTKDKGEIVKQLAIFTITTESVEEEHVIGALAILEALDLPPSIPIRVLAPYLDSDYPRLRGFVRDWFQSRDNLRVGRLRLPIDNEYTHYVQSRVARNEEIPTAFIEYLYERSAGRALLVLQSGNVDLSAELHAIRKNLEAARQGRETTGQDEIRQQREKRRRERREILLAEHIISSAIWLKENDFPERFQTALPEAAGELRKLAKHQEWWVRLYVAWAMRRYPELRQPDVLQQLSGDNNALVSKAAKSVGK